MFTIDFETKGIKPYPDYPPKPVGVAIKYNDLPAAYLSWGHPSGNNCTRDQADALLASIWDSGEQILCHNARFDIEVSAAEFDLVWPDWRRVDDTMYLIFLDSPLARTVSLKPSAERLLGLPPDEQSAVRDWLVQHGVVRENDKHWGAHISDAPAEVVAPYAAGDVDRTYAIFQLLYPKIVEAGMVEAYDRERKLAPILNRAEKEGIRIDHDKLVSDAATYRGYFNKATKRIKELLNQENEEFNIDSGVQLAEAIRFAGYGCHPDEWPKTPTGKFSTSRDTLMQVLQDGELKQLLVYRGALKTVLGTFMEPWVEKAHQDKDGYWWIHPSWNQVRGDEYGTRTGRLSSSDPNFQNIPTEFENIVIPEGYPALPLMRVYILPDPGEVIVSADFHSQEIRMLGHFAEGAIAAIYRDNPSADIHEVAADLINDVTGLALNRKHTKITAFSILYGAGAGTMAGRLSITPPEARRIKTAYLKVLEGVQEFMWAVENRARMKESVRSWGGRRLFAPEPVVQANGQVWNKDYVLLNYLIQGSSADQTKEAINNYDDERMHGRFLMTVHDEIVISVNPRHLTSEVEILKRVMAHGDFALPMRATVEAGENWAEMVDV